MEGELCGVDPETDKIQPDKSKKRVVKTPSQIEALEKFYTEHKYPSETAKIEIADSIGLTEKQVSGWFCHRRSKDKRFLCEETHAMGRQDGLSAVIQDHGSGHRQDSYCSSKRGDDGNCDAREVESGRNALQEFPSADLTFEHGSKYVGKFNRMDDATSGSTSSLRNMPSLRNSDTFDVATSRSLVPKYPTEPKGVKDRSGPSGYLKVKGKIENSAVTAVKRQLGRHYREDGPPLSVEFDLLPPGAFEPSTQNPDDEVFCSEEQPPTSPNVSRHHEYPSFNKGSEYKLDMNLFNSNIERSKMAHSSDAHKSDPKNLLPNYSAYHAADSGSKIDYRKRYRQGIETVRMDSASNHHHSLPYGIKVAEERTESWPHRSSHDVSRQMHRTEESEDESYHMCIRGNEYHNFEDGEQPPQKITKDGKFYVDRRAMNGCWESNGTEIPLKNDCFKKDERCI